METALAVCRIRPDAVHVVSVIAIRVDVAIVVHVGGVIRIVRAARPEPPVGCNPAPEYFDSPAAYG